MRRKSSLFKARLILILVIFTSYQMIFIQNVFSNGESIIVNDADDIFEIDQVGSNNLTSIASEVDDRIIINNADSVIDFDDISSTNLDNKAEQVDDRIIVNYADAIIDFDSIYSTNLTNTANEIDDRIIIDYADSCTDFDLVEPSTLHQLFEGPSIFINTLGGNYYNVPPIIDVDFVDITGLDDAYYMVDSYAPTGLDTTGWTPIFTSHSGTSYTTDFAMDSSIWNGLSDGNYTVYFKAWDDLGNINDGETPIWQFYIDTNPPIITINTLNGSYFDSSPLMDVDFSDGGGLDYAYYKLDFYTPTGFDTTGWTQIFTDHSGTSYSTDFTMDNSIWNGLSEGSHIVYFKSWDDSGHINDGSLLSWQFFKVNDPLNISINILDGNYYISTPLMDVDFSDALGLDNAYYKVDFYTPTGLNTTGWTPIFTDHSGTSYSTDFAMNSSVWNGLSDGNHTVYFKAWDDEGIVKDGVSISWQFYKDTTIPLILLKSPGDNSVRKSGTQINLDITDSNGLNDVLYKWDNAASNSTYSPLNPPTIPTGDGVHLLYIFAYDNTGNFGNKTFFFICDDTNPTATFEGISEGMVLEETITITVSASDENGISHILFYINEYQTANQSNNNDFSLNTKSYSDGDYVFKFRVCDLAGNYFEQQFSIEIKNKDTPPFIPGFHLGFMLNITLISIVIFTLKRYKEQQRKGVNRISFN